MLTDYKDIEALMRAEEDGRGGRTYEDRNTGWGVNDKVVKGPRKLIRKCNWCNKRVVLAQKYHPECLKRKDTLKKALITNKGGLTHE